MCLKRCKKNKIKEITDVYVNTKCKFRDYTFKQENCRKNILRNEDERNVLVYIE